ncbi:hypothetical protein Tco_1427469 [Tanacetum coccineum]
MRWMMCPPISASITIRLSYPSSFSSGGNKISGFVKKLWVNALVCVVAFVFVELAELVLVLVLCGAWMVGLSFCTGLSRPLLLLGKIWSHSSFHTPNIIIEPFDKIRIGDVVHKSVHSHAFWKFARNAFCSSNLENLEVIFWVSRSIVRLDVTMHADPLWKLEVTDP